MFLRVRPAARFFSLARRAPLARSRLAARSYSQTSGLSAEDSELAAALRAERKIELEELAAQANESSQSVAAFLERSGFELRAVPARDQVELVKKLPNETVRVHFSVSDVLSNDELFDEEYDDKEAEPEELEYDGGAPMRLSVVVEKAKGAVAFEAMLQDDVIVVESATPYASAALASEDSAEAEYSRSLVYKGPQFSLLDPTVQSAVMQYLDKRGINGDLGAFVVEYSSQRENSEYVAWLERFAEFVEN